MKAVILSLAKPPRAARRALAANLCRCRHQRNKLKAASPGFTLIELLTVIAIISALAALSIGVGHYVRQKARTSRTKAEMAAVENAMEQYKSDNGTYPPYPTISNIYLSSIVIYEAAAAGPKKYLTFKPAQLQTNIPNNSNTIIDPFGRPYYYLYPGVSNSASFDLWSAGPNTIINDDDDIVNWRQ